MVGNLHTLRNMIRCDHRFILFSIVQTTARLSMSVRYKSYYGEAEYSGKYGDYTITPLGNYDGAICVVRMGDGLEGRDEGEEDIRSIKGRASTSLT